MKLEVTREVINDLWPLYQAGEASPDSRVLINAFLAEDQTFASILRNSERIPRTVPSLHLAAEAERRLLDTAKEKARLRLLLTGVFVTVATVVLLIVLAAILLLAFRS